MATHEDATAAGGPLDEQRQIDAVCDDFERAYRAGDQPKIEDYLARLDKYVESHAVRHLLQLEIELLQQDDESIDVDRYRRRFFAHRSAVEVAIATALADQSSIASTKDRSGPTKYDKSRTIGPYKLLQRIGHGGMGEVWMAEQEKPVRRRVAVKLIRAGMDSKEVVARFEAERQALAMMDHHNIAKVLDAGETDAGQPYFVMELVQGIPFNQYCDKNQLTLKERLELFIPICKAVQHAHQKGIIHRDLKPTNVLVTLYDGKPVPKVIDFGLAKALQHQVRLTDRTLFTEFNQVVGTVQYMSPEQAEMNALDVDTRSDIYSLGVMLYELLTGSTPIEKETIKKHAIFEVLRLITESDPPRPSIRLSDSGDAIKGISAQRKIESTKLQQLLRGDLDWIAMKALEKDRTRRYATAEALTEDVERFLANEPVEARPPSLGYRLHKTIRKYRRAVAVGIVIVALLVSGIVSTSWMWYRAAAATADADRKADDLEDALGREQEAHLDADAQTKLAVRRFEIANERKRIADLRLYANKLRLAQTEWQHGDPILALRTLESCRLRYRGLEYDILNSMFRDCLAQTLFGHLGGVNCVVYSVDKTRIVSGGDDALIKYWDANTGTCVRTLRGRPGGVNCFAISPNEQVSAVVDGNTTVMLWDRERFIRSLEHEHGVDSIALSPDGQRIASGIRGEAIRLWDVETGNLIHTLRTDDDRAWEQGAYSKVAFSPDGRLVVTPGTDNGVMVWDYETPNLDFFEGHDDRVTCVAFSADGRRIVTGSVDGSIKVWSADKGDVLATLIGHRGSITDVVFNSDADEIVSASVDGTIRLWDAVTGNELEVLKGHTAAVTDVVLRTDAKQIISASRDHTIKVWDLERHAFSREMTHGNGRIWSVAVSPKGDRVASGGRDGSVVVWDCDTGDILTTFLEHTAPVTHLAFSPDGSLIASACLDYSVRLWAADSGDEILKPKELGSASCLGFGPAGKVFFCGGGDSDASVLRVWDTKTGEQALIIDVPTERERTKVLNAFTDVTFSPYGRWIVSGGRSVKMWNARTGAELRSMAGHVERVSAVAFNADGTRIVSGSTDAIKVWDAMSGKELLSIESNGEPGVSFSPDGRRIVGAYPFRIWDSETGEELLAMHNWQGFATVDSKSTRIATTDGGNVLSIHHVVRADTAFTLRRAPELVECVAVSPDGDRIASASNDEKLELFDTSTDEILTMVGHSLDVRSLAFSRDGHKIISGSGAMSGDLNFPTTKPNEIKIWDTSTGNVVQTLSEHGDAIVTIAVSPDGRHFASGSWDSHIKIWEIGEEKSIHTLLGHDEAIVQSVAYSPDGKRIASGGSDDMVRIWDSQTGEQLRNIEGHEDAVTSVAFGSGGRWIVSGSHDNTIRIWNSHTGDLLRSLNGHRCPVYAVAVSPDGKYIASGGCDTFIKIWNGESGEVVHEFRGHTSVITSLAFTPDGNRLVSGSRDYTVRVWNLDGVIGIPR